MNVFARFWFEKNEKSYIGVGRAELLTRIAESGSISKAAKQMGMSYKAAWDSVDIMNKLSPSPLVESFNGGKGGGGTKLTPLGFEALKAFNELERVKNILKILKQSRFLSHRRFYVLFVAKCFMVI